MKRILFSSLAVAFVLCCALNTRAVNMAIDSLSGAGDRERNQFVHHLHGQPDAAADAVGRARTAPAITLGPMAPADAN